MVFCEKGILERENEEQRLIEQRTYEAGRDRQDRGRRFLCIPFP